ncbi:MAG: nucleotidyltransferase domain-containing protein [Bacteroidia bacterium]
MVTQQSAIKTVNAFINEVKAEGVQLKKVILFGSIARNQQQEYSDIDVALISDQFVGVGFVDIPLFIKALRNHFIIQPKTFSSMDFEEGDAFTDEIKRTGIEIKV